MTEGTPSSSDEPVRVEDSELVARALFTPEWDERVQRGTPGCFKRNNTSVTRHKDLSFPSVLAYLKGDVEKVGSAVVVRAVGIISVANIKALGLQNQNPVHFEVYEKKTAKNPAHAEITPFTFAVQASPNREVSRGLSRQISSALDIIIVAPDGEIEGRSPPLR